MIGIISYLPNDDELRNKRVGNCKKQIEWLHKVFPNECPVVVAQNYHEDDKVTECNVEYLMYEKGIGSHKARNTILEKFYNSSDEWLLLLDDDVVTYDYYEADKWVADVYYRKYDKYPLNIVLALQPETSPFKELNIKNDVAHYYTLTKSAATNCPNMMLFRHPDKEHEVFFDDTIDLLAEDAVPDDNKFIVECIHKGMNVHRADFWIKKSFDRLVSVIYSKDKDENWQQHANLGKNLANYIIKTYKVKNVAEFNKIYNKTLPIRIEREEVYKVPENLLPKKKVEVNNTKRLF